MSSVGARAAGSPFFRTKHAAEEAVRGSSLEHIILRPSVIYGPGDRFTTAIALLLRRLPVYPVLSVGRLRLQPVAIEDVADALAQTVSRQDLTSGTYELAGPERLKFSKIVRIVARALGLRRPVIQLPKAVSSPALWLVSRFDLPTPISAEQLELFRASSVLSRADNPLRTVFRIEPLPFRDAVTDYL
jgi:NADH dehydrogenase